MYIDALLEEFNFDPFGSSSLDNFSDVTDMYESGIRFNEEIYQEAAGIVPKKGNIFKRLWNFLIKAWGWIKERFKKVINFFAMKSKPKKTTDQILSEIGVTPTHQPSEASGSSQVQSAPVSQKQGFVGPTEISLPSTSNNTTVQKSVPKSVRYSAPSKLAITKPDGNPGELAFKGLYTAFDNAGNVRIKIGEINVNRMAKAPVNPGPIPDAGKNFSAAWVIFCIEDSSAFNGYLKAAECIKKIVDYVNQKKESMDMFDPGFYNLIDEFRSNVRNTDKVAKKFVMALNPDYSFSISQIQEFNNKLNKVYDIINSINEVIEDVSAYEVDIFIKSFNQFCLDVDYFQMGINTITAALMNVFSIDARYYESIKDPEVLSKFAEECVNSAIPQKYITYNIFLVSTRDIKGKGKARNPINGQSRAVFFPSSNTSIIYKVAINKMGTKANANEIRLTNAFKKDPEAIKLITPTTYTSKNNYVISSSRADDKSIGHLSSDIIDSVRNSLKNACLRLGILRDPSNDIHSGNVGTLNGHAVCVDYGSLAARSSRQ